MAPRLVPPPPLSAGVQRDEEIVRNERMSMRFGESTMTLCDV